MSKLGAFGHFLRKVAAVAPGILMFTPLAPIAGIVQAAIGEAEAIGGSGPDKLAHVLAVAHDAGEAINAQAGHEVVNVTAVDQTAATIISSVITASKIPASSYHDPNPAATPINPAVTTQPVPPTEPSV